MTFSSLTTPSKGKAKVGKNVWDNPATALGSAHNVVTNNELKGLSSIPFSWTNQPSYSQVSVGIVLDVSLLLIK